MPEYRVAILAAGRIAAAHARGYQMVADTTLTAAADTDPAALNSFCDRFAIRNRYTDYATLLKKEKPEIVSVCSHETLHAAMVIGAARHKPLAILCEKPMALTLAEADAMVAACRRAGTMLVIGHQRRFSPQYIAARQVVESGRLGPIRLIEAYGHPGTSLLVDSTHTVDLIRFFMDEEPVDWVLGQVDDRAGREAWGHPIEAASVAWIAFKNGSRALLTAGGAAALGGESWQGLGPSESWDGPSYHHFVIHGRDARLEVDGDAPVGGRALVRIHRGKRAERVPLPWPLEMGWGWELGQPLPQHLPPFAQEIRTIVDCLENGGEHPLRAQRARDALEILIAIYESARQRAVVRFPVTVQGNPLFEMRARQG
jgi:predicted dehydrogenase